MHAAARATTDSEKQPRRWPSLEVIGSPGTHISGGRIDVGDRTALRGRALVERAEHLQRTEPIVAKMLRLVKGTTTSVTYQLKGGDKSTPLGREVYAACEEALGLGTFRGRGKMRRDFSTTIDPFHLFWWIGYRYGELVWKVDRGADGRLRYWIDDIVDCEPSAHDYWVTQDNRTLDGVIQRRVNVGDKPDMIPAEKLWLLTWQQTGANWEGLGAARVASWSAKAKEHVMLWMMRAVERVGSGIPITFLDAEGLEKMALSRDDAEVEAMVTEMDAAIAAMRSGALGARFKANSAVYPKSYGDTVLDVHRWIALVGMLNDEVLHVANANFTTLGLNDTGSRAVGEVHSSYHRRSGAEIVDAITGSFTAQPLRRFVEYNFGAEGVRVMPAVGHFGLDTEKTSQALNVMGSLALSGLLGGKLAVEHGIPPEVVRAVQEAVGVSIASDGSVSAPALTPELQAAIQTAVDAAVGGEVAGG